MLSTDEPLGWSWVGWVCRPGPLSPSTSYKRKCRPQEELMGYRAQGQTQPAGDIWPVVWVWGCSLGEWTETLFLACTSQAAHPIGP